MFLDSHVPSKSGQRRELSQKLAATRGPLELKRLTFIPSYSTYYSRKIAALYSNTRSRLPSALQPKLEVMETRVSIVSSPVVQAMQNRSEFLLSSLDRKVLSRASFTHAA